MNSRKLSVTATLSISCRVFVPDSLCLTSGFAQDDGHLEQLTATHTVTVPAAVHRREFTLMDDVNLTDFSRYAAITAARGELRLSDCRLMNGKAVLKGDAALHLLVETTDGLLENTDCVVPFTQIFEVEGMTDNQQVCVSFSLRHLDAELRDDGLIGVGIGASVLLTAFETHPLQLVSDVYRTILRRKNLFIQAPTGTGKTVSVLFPAVRAVGEEQGEKIFYLTAKIVARLAGHHNI